MKLFAHWNDRRWETDIEREGERLIVRSEGEALELRFDDQTRALRSVLFDSREIDFAWTRKGDAYRIVLAGAPYEITVRDLRSERIASMQSQASSGPRLSAEIRAPIPGLIRRVLVKEGDAVAKGQPLLTLDAMKMENEIGSPIDAKVGEVRARPGATVEKDELLLILVATTG